MESELPLNAPVFRIRLLGPPGIEGPDGALVGGATQRHRMALLALLAAAPSGLVSRERLIGLLWPEYESANARNLLSAAVHFLRKALGDDVLVAEGDAIRLDAARVRIDLLEFQGAVARGEAERAVELYGGPLLEGLALRETSEFEQWHESERDRIERVFHAQLEHVARTFGDPPASVHWWRRRVACSPSEGRVVIELMRALERAGDRAGALQVASAHELLLSKEFDAAPDAQVTQLAEQLRRRGGDAVAASDASPHLAATSDTDHTLAVPGTPLPPAASRPARAPRARARFVAVATAAIVVVAFAAGSVWRALARTTGTSASLIAIFPFQVASGSGMDLGEGMMDALSSTLDGLGELRASDPYAVMSRLRLENVSGAPVLDHARRIAASLGASRFVVGRVATAHDSIRVWASLYQVDDATAREQRAEVVVASQHVATLGMSVARALLAGASAGEGEWLAAAGRAVTVSPRAWHAWARGEMWMRRPQEGAYDSAVASFRRAVAEDSTFALASMRLARAENYLGPERDSAMIAAIDRAARHTERLTPPQKALLAVMLADYHGRPEEAVRLARAYVRDFPHLIEGWFVLGAKQFWWAWRLGTPPAAAETALMHARRLDAGHRQALHMLSWASAVDGNLARSDSLYTKAWGVPIVRLPANVRRQAAFLKRMSNAASFPDSIIMVIQGARRTTDTDSLPDALRIADFAVASAATPVGMRSRARWMRGLVELTRGRTVSAALAFAHAREVSSVATGELEEAWVFALPFVHADSARLHDIRDSLVVARRNSPRVEHITPANRLWGPPLEPRHVRLYLAGLVSAKLRDDTAALRYARELTDARPRGDSIGLVRDLSLEIRAVVAKNRGGARAALLVLDSLRLQTASHYDHLISTLHMRPLGRLLRADALLESGRYDEAVPWYPGLSGIANLDFVFGSWTHYRLGQAHEGARATTKALEHYQRFIARWREADAPYQQFVSDAKTRIAALTR